MTTHSPATLFDRTAAAAIDARAGRAGSGVVVAFTSAIFLSAALLFVVQPMVGRMILPLLGGTPAVWNTCMVFFQACLLLGYAYAHVATRFIPPRVQPIVHVGLMLAPLIVLPIGLRAGWAPPADGNPAVWVLVLLAMTAGLPFVVVSTSGPLLQRWFARTGHPDAHDPYFLYAASNLGSMIALLGYPLLVEPATRLAQQSAGWTVGYVGLVGITAYCAAIVLRTRHVETPQVKANAATDADAPPSWRERIWWVVLAFVPSSYLLGATTYVTSDLAAMPLLWVIPLALYLLSFILVFARRQLVPQRVVRVAMPLAVAACVYAMVLARHEPLWLIVTLHLLTLLLVSMACHGELARRRPHASRLTEFYLLMSVGGVLGGAFNALLAPVLFITPLEYPIVMVLACLVVSASVATALASVKDAPRVRHLGRLILDVGLPAVLLVATWAILIVIAELRPQTGMRLTLAAIPLVPTLLTLRRPVRFGLCVAGILGAVAMADLTNPKLVHVTRSFFGTHRVNETTVGRDRHFHELMHGTTVHGRQRIDAETGMPIEPRQPSSYYHPTGPVARLMNELVSRPPGQRPRDVAVVGLGTGSLAAFAEPGMRFTFYEIDPRVKDLAENPRLYTFVSAARERQASVDVVLGDARLTLGNAADASLDLLVLDAFSGDAIPVHLLTREAMDRYVAKLRPGGILAVHISNRYLDLTPVVSNLARHAGWAGIGRSDWGVLADRDIAQGAQASFWIVLTRDPSSFGKLTSAQEGWRPIPSAPTQFLWTDDFSNIVGVFNW